MGTRRRKVRNNNSNAFGSNGSAKQFKKIPSLEREEVYPSIIGVTNDVRSKWVARILSALLIVAMISVIVISLANLF